jgi:hypothetical protein
VPVPDDPRLESATVTACFMEIPVEDFGHLPQELGCSLQRTEKTLTLVHSEQPGCVLHFKVEGLQAQLASVDIGHDPEGRFFRDVLGLILQLYSGDLEAKLTFSPQGAMDERVQVRAGESTHPLLFQGEALPREISFEHVEQWLAEAQQAWSEYRSLKSQKPSQKPRSEA